MAMSFDPEIVQDFLTESGELLEKLEGDLVELEKAPNDPEMINQIFRALHTIKGSASFLALNNLVRIAHAAESALNAARNRVVRLDRQAMDLLLNATDVINTQMRQLAAGEELAVPPEATVQGLTRLGEGKPLDEAVRTPSAAADAPQTAGANPAAAPRTDTGAGLVVTPISFPPGKSELVEFLVADLKDSLARSETFLAAMDEGNKAAAEELAELTEALTKAVEFFDLDPLTKISTTLARAVSRFEHLPKERHLQLIPRMKACVHLLAEMAEGVRTGELRVRPFAVLLNRMALAASDDTMKLADTLPAGVDLSAALVFDGVTAGTMPGAAAAPVTTADGTPEHDAEQSGAGKAGPKASGSIESSIRVDVGRLEALMNLVGELVLQKNRIAAISRQFATNNGKGGQNGEFAEAMSLAAGGLDRVTGDIQTAVMKTRMQPLEKLFGRYPRLIRDLALKTGKKIDLVIEGGDTEVDKSVIEELGDPLIHLLRNSADHGLEAPNERAAAGKPTTGTIILRASHEGSHVRLLVIDDGRGLARDRIAKKAVERGLVTAEQASTLSDREVFRFIFEAGFSTADKVSDLSGRGVGMDVVRTNIEKVKGTIDLSSEQGRGTTVSITIPLTVAILPAMMVGVGPEIYAIPLGNILEIVKLSEQRVSTIGEHPVIQLRDSVLPLVSGVDAFHQVPKPGEHRAPTPFAVILSQNDRRIGLGVTRLIGQQEIVVKPLDGVVEHKGGAVSGATVRDDGGVSLIADISELMRIAESLKLSAA